MKTHNNMLMGLAVVTALAAGGCFAPVAAANDHPDAPRRGRGANYRAALGLTAEQKAQMREILRQHLPVVEPLAKQFVTERRALRELIHAENLNEAAIRAQARQAAKVGEELAVLRARLAQEWRGVLTPEQIEQLEERRDDLEERFNHFLDRVAKRIAQD